ncbi:nitrate/nitrite transporter [Rothia sp. ZJ1223]|nr:MFS transporter [Rothia sp. ZJ1223]MBM7051134.1 MFS transporter [Rothia sp. ZJ1223]
MKWLVWAVGVLAYVLAVINRSSFAALGPVAQEHFGVDATVLSSFITAQLVVYAMAQIPVGVVLDRWGAPALVTAGMVSMSIGQFLLGNAETVWGAVLARLLVGMGDACIFVSMIRLISEWFLPRQIPVVNQISGNIGQMGQVVAVTPLVVLVQTTSWQTGFTVLAALCLLCAVAAVFCLRDKPQQQTIFQKITHKPASVSSKSFHSTVLNARQSSPITEALPIIGPNSSGIAKALKSLLKRPGIRMAFWIHLSLCFTVFNFTLLWGTPFITGGLGYTEANAAFLITTIIVTLLVFGFFAGSILRRFTRYRVHIAVGVATINQILWAIVLFFPGTPPLWLLTVLAVALGTGGPISMVAFDVVRSHAPLTQRGVATAIANMGGYTGTFVMMFVVGLLLDIQGAGNPESYALQPFKNAMMAQLVFGVISILVICWEYPKAKRYLNSKGVYL